MTLGCNNLLLLTEVGRTQSLPFEQKTNQMMRKMPPLMEAHAAPEAEKSGLTKRDDNHRCDSHNLRPGYEGFLESAPTKGARLC